MEEDAASAVCLCFLDAALTLDLDHRQFAQPFGSRARHRIVGQHKTEKKTAAS